MLEQVPVTAAHVDSFVASMREVDVAECHALGLGTHEAVLQSWQRSDVSAAMVLDGETIAIAGLVFGGPDTPRTAQAWLLVSHAVAQRCPVAFRRATRDWLNGSREWADVLWNYVDARNTLSLRWLERLDFHVGQAIPRGVAQLPFHLVTRRTQ